MTKKKNTKKTDHVRLIPLGGLGEVGKNMNLLEYKGKILIIDVGIRFPEEDTPGVDYIISNTSYLHKRKKDIVGIIFTHGHYDHIGALPYLMDKIYTPKIKIFASPLTKGIILKRQDDFPGQPKLNIKTVEDGSKIKLPPFDIEFFRQNHNIPDTLGMFIKTPVGNIVHSADFKFDENPVNAPPTDYEKLKSLGKRGVLLLMSDSTGAEEEGHSLSEKKISENLEKIFEKANGRIIVATFSSLLNRIQQIITLSEKNKRKVCIEGYSMRTNVNLAERLGYLKMKKNTLIRTQQIKKYPESKVTVLCTGAQGEEEAALMRIITKEHRLIKLNKKDTVVFSSSIIPGNERTVQFMKDEILLQGADIYHYEMMDIHAGGHGKREELKEMIELMNPKYLMPIHGQHSMLFSHAKIAKEAGIPEDNVIVAENGQVIKVKKDKVYITKEEVPSNLIMVDGLGVGDVGEIVLRDRKRLADDGIFVIIAVVDKKTGKVRGSPDIISRGFVYLRESKKLLHEARKKVIKIVNSATGSGGAVNWRYIKKEIRNKLGQFLYSKTERRPMVLSVLIEV